MVNSAGEKDKYSLQFELKTHLGSINKVCMYVFNDFADRKSMPEMECS